MNEKRTRTISEFVRRDASTSARNSTLNTPTAQPTATPVRPTAQPQRPLSTVVSQAQQQKELSKTTPIDKKEPPLMDQPKKSLSIDKKRRNLPSRNTILNVLTAISIIVTAYIAIDVWRTNQNVKESFTANQTEAITSNEPQNQEGSDETPIPDDALKNYSVAPDLPRALYIDKLDVSARILPMTVNPDNSMQSPINIHDAGWYSLGVKPGDSGASVLNAHSSGRTRQGLFSHLDQLEKGDEIIIERGDGTKLAYNVTKVATVPLDQVDMSAFMKPYGSATEGLNLMTCWGAWMKEGQTYDHRIVVYTERLIAVV